MRRCESCHHYLSEANVHEGICRAHPPVPILAGYRPAVIAGRPPEPMIITVDPNVPADHCCGEFLARQTETSEDS
jgi:hypothetical protein